MGVREYRPEDSRRQIHWKATARTGDLAVKVLEHVSQTTIMLVLNAATFEQVWIGVDRASQDAVVETAAGLARASLTEGLAVGLAANGAAPGFGRGIRVAPGRGRAQLRALLEGLAAVSSYVTVPPERLVAREARSAPWGATLVVITPVVAPALAAQMARVRRTGRPVALVAPLEAGAARIPGVARFPLVIGA
jgi:uncharacterized protein (DUF58 family)